MTRKQSMRTKHAKRSTSKRHRSLRKRSGGVGIFDSEPSNATDDALPLHKKVLNFFTNIFSSAPPVPQNASPLPRPGQPAQQLQQVQRPVQQQTPESTNFGSDDIAQFTPPDATATAISQSPPVPPPDAAPQFGSPTTAFGGRRRRSNKNKNKNKKK
jgi:hypothetical protein